MTTTSTVTPLQPDVPHNERRRKALGHKLAALTEVLRRAGKARVSPGQPQGGYLEAYQLLEEGRRDRP
ncbi:hypothetical protein TbrSNM41_25260 (plasmid) [Thermus brockianus]|uniref:Uncharacterized protein n=1 Tax=Thermus brockianus TaxID=56956 RepID=A0ABM7XN39_THEBO|nr:hypothetical protein TbrSNM41_25260 [Thermus brockianus]